MRHFKRLLLVVPFIAFFSCSQQVVDDGWESNELPEEPETHLVGVNFSRASLETFAQQGITEIGIYVYLKDSMVYGKSLPLNDGNLKVELPLGESLQTFAVANADHLTDADSLSKVIVYQDTYSQKQVYISDIVNLTSDYSSTTFNLELKRLVGEAIFQPTESLEVIDNITLFDHLNVTFTNVGVAYKVKTGACIQEDVTISLDRASRFTASVYSFPTITGDSRTSVDAVYMKDGIEVNRTNSPLDTGIAFEPSKRSTVFMPILEEAYLQNSWPHSRALTNMNMPAQSFIVKESEF